jgi:hypothetical protein
VLICGGHTFHDVALFTRTLDSLHATTPFSVVIYGAATGPGALVGTWALAHRIPVERYPADWAKHGRKAAQFRDGQMFAKGKPDLVVAFPGADVTRRIMEMAKVAGIKLIEA